MIKFFSSPKPLPTYIIRLFSHKIYRHSIPLYYLRCTSLVALFFFFFFCMNIIVPLLQKAQPPDGEICDRRAHSCYRLEHGNVLYICTLRFAHPQSKACTRKGWIWFKRLNSRLYPDCTISILSASRRLVVVLDWHETFTVVRFHCRWCVNSTDVVSNSHVKVGSSSGCCYGAEKARMTPSVTSWAIRSPATHSQERC